MIKDGFKITTVTIGFTFIDVVIYEKKKFLGIIPYWYLVYQDGECHNSCHQQTISSYNLLSLEKYDAWLQYHYDKFMAYRKSWGDRKRHE